MCASHPTGGAPHRVLVALEAFGQPSPFLSVLYKVYRGAVNAILCCYSALRSLVCVDCDNLTLGKDRLRVFLALRFCKSMPAFLHGIRLIVRSGSGKKMAGINADRIVTVVADFHAWMDRPFKVLVEIARSYALPRPSRDHTVATWVFTSLPNPATVAVWNVAGKWINSLSGHALIVTRFRVTHQGVR